MSSDEFRSLVIGKTEYEATSQNNAIYERFSYARLLENKMVRNVGDDPPGSIELSNESGVDNEKIFNFDRDKPKLFKLSEFEKHVDKVQGRKPNSTDNLAPSNKDSIKVESILKKLRILRVKPQLKFIMDEFTDEAPKLDQILRHFIGDDSGKHVRIIDISRLPNEVAGPLTALKSRLLFQYKLWQTTNERKKDHLLLICEETHRYVPNQGEAQYKEAQVTVRRIAKEGRKYSLGLGLVS